MAIIAVLAASGRSNHDVRAVDDSRANPFEIKADSM